MIKPLRYPKTTAPVKDAKARLIVIRVSSFVTSNTKLTKLNSQAMYLLCIVLVKSL
jgi:hypothetical protein